MKDVQVFHGPLKEHQEMMVYGFYTQQTFEAISNLCLVSKLNSRASKFCSAVSKFCQVQLSLESMVLVRLRHQKNRLLSSHYSCDCLYRQG
jgi:hypothetical protein